MTEVCILGKEGADVRFDLMTYETARRALSAYELRETWENSVAVETISVGTAVSLLGDLDWYLVRVASEALVREPSVSETEWLTRDLAREIREQHVDPEETGDLLKIYGVEYDEDDPYADEPDGGEDGRDGGADGQGAGRRRQRRGRLVEPMYVRRLDDHLPEYDLRDVEETVVVRVTEAEFQ